MRNEETEGERGKERPPMADSRSGPSHLEAEGNTMTNAEFQNLNEPKTTEAKLLVIGY